MNCRADKLVITGSSGFIGRRLSSYLENLGYSGLAVSRRPNQNLPNNWNSASREDFITNKTKLQCRIVIHLEAKHHVIRSDSAAAAEFVQVNVEGTQTILDAAERAGCTGFIYFSSIKAVEPKSNFVTEHGLGPGNTQYGRSKWEAEKLVEKWVAIDPNRWALILRPAVVYGPGNTANIYSMVDAIARRRFPLVNAGVNVKSVVSLENICAAVAFLLSRRHTGVEVFNVTDPLPVTVKAISGYMADALGVPRPSRTLPLSAAKTIASIGDLLDGIGFPYWPLNTNRLAGLTEDCYFSPTKLLEAGYLPVETTQQGINRLVDWYKSQKQTGRD